MSKADADFMCCRSCAFAHRLIRTPRYGRAPNGAPESGQRDHHEKGFAAGDPTCGHFTKWVDCASRGGWIVVALAWLMSRRSRLPADERSAPLQRCSSRRERSTLLCPSSGRCYTLQHQAHFAKPALLVKEHAVVQLTDDGLFFADRQIED